MSKRIKNTIDDFTVTLPFALNEQQIKVLREIDDFVRSPYEMTMTVSGWAGTGKTTLMEIVEKRYWGKKEIFYAATTHKAAGVLKSKVKKPVSTVNSLFGIMIELNMDMDEFDVTNRKRVCNKENKLKRDSIVIIDESSMLSEDNYYDVINKCRSYNCKIIFLGDSAQLSPVNENNISIVFRNKKSRIVELTRIERTDNDFILNESSLVRTQGGFSYESKMNDESGVEYIDCTNSQKIVDVFDRFIPGLKTNPNYFRILSYTNRNVEKLNVSIRAKLGYDSQIPEIGEPLMGYANWGYISGYPTAQYVFTNSESYTMLGCVGTRTVYVKDMCPSCQNYEEDMKMTIVDIEISDALGKTIKIPFIDIKENKENLMAVKVMCKEKINLWMKYRTAATKYEKGKCLEEIHALDDLLFVNDNVKGDTGNLLQSKVIDFGYAHTIHKSQGSTFENVLINDVDVDSCPNSTVKRQLRYVALTRATKNVKIITNKVNQTLKNQKEENLF